MIAQAIIKRLRFKMNEVKKSKVSRIRLLLKRIISSLFYPFHKISTVIYNPQGFRILLYHSIDDDRDSRDVSGIRVPIDRFRRQMDFLFSNGYQVHSLLELMEMIKEGKKLPKKALAITFDDGYKDNLENAFNILQNFRFPATFFVSVDYIDGTAKSNKRYWENWDFLSWEDLMFLHQQGFAIGSHGCSHRRLSTLPESEQSVEVKKSKKIIESYLNEQIRLFSYPHGSYNARTKEMLQNEGYSVACSSIYGVNKRGVDSFKLRRIEVVASDNLFEFQKKVIGSYDWLSFFQNGKIRC